VSAFSNTLFELISIFRLFSVKFVLDVIPDKKSYGFKKI